ncbi:UMP kinase [Candidatus Woesearchaeota archaeon]|nr:UMP kinase [Candidatus Woesearchaeota archaeon]
MTQTTIILSLGGSLIYPKDIDVAYLKQFREIILSLVSHGKRFGIITGGGWICREYLRKANEITPLHTFQNDMIGILTTRTNAQLVREIFGDTAYKDVVIDYSRKIVTDKPIIVGAGWIPGSSTDKDAVLLAQQLGAKTVINLTNVDYVYDKDPRKFSDAKPIKEISWNDFRKIVGGEWKAGMNLPFDPIAAALAEKDKMKVIVLNGNNLSNLQHCLAGKNFVGTVIG